MSKIHKAVFCFVRWEPVCLSRQWHELPSPGRVRWGRGGWDESQ
jgi:hypothetical protein